MFMAAAKALASLSPAANSSDANLLPPVAALREVAMQVARAVAMQAQSEGLAPEMESEALTERIKSKVWTPAYVPYLRASASG
jgi:malate dehydrogenase (oxaloacetate-decarboxylating)